MKVGTRIAVLAEPDDDLSTLSIPADDSKPISSPQEDTKSGIDPSSSSESQAKAPPSSKGEDTPPTEPSTENKPDSAPPGKPQKQTYPLYPSIAQLLAERDIPPSDADKIPASGPKGRLLKGDVLSYLGTISSSYSSDQSERIKKLSHLDLSAAKAAPPPEKESPPPPLSKKQALSEPEPEPDTEIAMPISFQTVLETQKRIQSTLGVTLPLSTFIARAIELANDDLPPSEKSTPSADELFDEVLGLNNVASQTSSGDFLPQVTALPPFDLAPVQPRKPLDIIDELTMASLTPPSRSFPDAVVAPPKEPGTTNVFSVSVAKGDEKRARVFLERMKTILQVEPGRLVL